MGYILVAIILVALFAPRQKAKPMKRARVIRVLDLP